jgi:hypothetical protein
MSNYDPVSIKLTRGRPLLRRPDRATRKHKSALGHSFALLCALHGFDLAQAVRYPLGDFTRIVGRSCALQGAVTNTRKTGRHRARQARGV